MKIYSLYSKSLKRYNLPFFANDDDEAIATVSRMVTAQADPSLICALDDLELFNLAVFYPSAPVDPDLISIDPYAIDISVLDDLHKNLPLPPTVKERIDKYYGGVQNA